MALAEARLVIAKLLWHFDIELHGDHANWVEQARFYVSTLVSPLPLALQGSKAQKVRNSEISKATPGVNTYS